MNKIAICLLIVLVSLFAVTTADFDEKESSNCCPYFQVYVPTGDSCFAVYESILFLRPTSDNLGWGVVTDFIPSVSPNWHIKTIQPNYHPAFNLDFCYTFPCSGIDTQLNWTHFRSSDSESTKVTPARQWVSPFSQTGPGTGDSNYDPRGVGKLTRARAKVWDKFDAINLETGVHINVGPYANMRLFAGLSGVRIKERIISHFLHRGGDLPHIRLNLASLFQGIGPRFGLDCAFTMCHNFKFVGGIAASLYFGRLNPAQYHFTGASKALQAGGISFNKESIDSDSVCHTVPALEANLGLNYESCLWGYEFTVEVGYMGAVYINSLRSYESATNVLSLDRGSLSTNSMKRVDSNFALDGPYGRLNIRF